MIQDGEELTSIQVLKMLLASSCEDLRRNCEAEISLTEQAGQPKPRCKVQEVAKLEIVSHSHVKSQALLEKLRD